MKIYCSGITCSLIAITLFSSCGASASLIPIRGKNYLYDDVNELHWLKISATTDMSYSKIVNSYYLDGWQHATGIQIISLFRTNLPSIVTTPITTAQYYWVKGDYFADFQVDANNEISNLSSLMGVTRLDSGLRYTIGIFGREVQGGYGLAQFGTRSDGLAFSYMAGASTGTTGTPLIGHFLVKPATAPVPLPTSTWLLGSGLLGLAGIARRRKEA